MVSETQKFSIDNERSQAIKAALKSVTAALREKGYDPVSQIVGYILSGDPTYITSYQDARSTIKKFDRDELMEEVITSYIREL
ncbi:MAG: IreB family regulatory phosphoprotein [Eubacteriaceae bacterium]|nr:IreB family regulatory phosphoprotein [Eubacteriaceae bacterium]MBQ1465293.1 IreB family regulatory phosphoprotein [Eubacteriaceae bacterium]MBR2781504.1 IreB family regulatory phosphoprotein [Eubacteriaceae bacterium]MCR4894019.1 IreB family regulatory phosphoprotein [Eubacteriales bacterium]